VGPKISPTAMSNVTPLLRVRCSWLSEQENEPTERNSSDSESRGDNCQILLSEQSTEPDATNYANLNPITFVPRPRTEAEDDPKREKQKVPACEMYFSFLSEEMTFESIEWTSNSRICEVYLDGRYIQTLKGVTQPTSNEITETRYSCVLKRSMNAKRQLVIKFLSLRPRKDSFKLQNLSVKFLKKKSSFASQEDNSLMDNQSSSSNVSANKAPSMNPFLLLQIEQRLRKHMVDMTTKFEERLQLSLQQTNMSYALLENRIEALEREVRNLKEASMPEKS